MLRLVTILLSALPLVAPPPGQGLPPASPGPTPPAAAPPATTPPAAPPARDGAPAGGSGDGAAKRPAAPQVPRQADPNKRSGARAVPAGQSATGGGAGRGNAGRGSKAAPAPPAAVRTRSGSAIPASRSAGRLAEQAAKGTLDPEQVDSLIGVAEDISPDWAAWLRTRRESDPEGLRKAIQSQGRRLIALAVLREHSPDLYELKVAELRLQSEVGDIAERYRTAMAAGSSAEAEALLKQLRSKTTQQVDESLKSRAAELAALDQQVRQLRERLEEDSLNRQARIDELLKAITDSTGGDPLPKPPGAAAPAASGAAAPAGSAPAGSTPAGSTPAGTGSTPPPAGQPAAPAR